MSKEENVTDENTNLENGNIEQNLSENPSEDELDALFDSHVTPETEEDNQEDSQVISTSSGDDDDDDDDDDDTPDETKNKAVEEGPSKEDLEKEKEVNKQIESGKNYIDQELINSIEDKELRQKVWSLANTANSHYGRYRQADEENRRLKADLQRLQQERMAQPNPANQAQKDEQDKEHAEKIKRLKDDYPDLADSIQALADNTFKQKSQEFEELIDQKYGQMRQRYEEDRRQQETQRLEEAANTIFRTEETGVSYRDVVASPDFSAWLGTQPESIQRFAESDDAAEVSRLLQMFESDYSREYRNQYGRDWYEDVKPTQSPNEETPSSANSNSDPTAESQANGSNRADQIAAKREQTLRKSVTGVRPSRSASTPDSPLNDPDAYFDHLASKSTRR